MLLWRSALSTSITELLLLLKFDNSGSSLTRGLKRFITWGGVPDGTLSLMFTCCPNLMFLTSSWLKIHRFSNWPVKTDPICSLLLTLNRSQLFHWIWARHTTKNNPNPTSLIKNSRTKHRIWHFSSYLQWFNRWESKTGFPSQ